MISPLFTQLRVIWALILKEVRSQYQDEPLGYVWALIEPVLHMLGWLVLVTLIRHIAPIGSSIITFLATGLLPIMIFQKVYSAMMVAPTANRQLLNYPIVQPNDTLIARFILESARVILVMIIIFTALVASGESDFPHDIPRAIEAVALILAVTFGFGVFSAYLVQISPIFDNIISIAGRALYFLSGIFFVPDMMPIRVQNILWYNPFVHGIELFRSAYYASFESSLPAPIYMIACAFLLTLFGFMFSSVERYRRRYS